MEHSHKEQLERLLSFAAARCAKVRVTTRRGQRMEVEPSEVTPGHASVAVGFSGRFTYTGIESVDVLA